MLAMQNSILLHVAVSMNIAQNSLKTACVRPDAFHLNVVAPSYLPSHYFVVTKANQHLLPAYLQRAEITELRYSLCFSSWHLELPEQPLILPLFISAWLAAYYTRSFTAAEGPAGWALMAQSSTTPFLTSSGRTSSVEKRRATAHRVVTAHIHGALKHADGDAAFAPFCYHAASHFFARIQRRKGKLARATRTPTCYTELLIMEGMHVS